MKINDAKVLGRRDSSRTGRSKQAAYSVPTDRIQLSKLNESVRAFERESPERLARLEALRADVQAGRYRVDSDLLSKSIIKDAFGS